MHPLKTMFVGLLALFALAGCQAPGAIAPVSAPVAQAEPGTQAVQARLDWGYHVAAVVNAYTKADVDHLKLSLYVKSGSSWVATGVTKQVSATALTGAVSLGNLKLATSYRVQADAYSDAAETQLISTAAGSQTDFTMPGLITTAGVASVDDAPVALAIKVTLADKTYAGTASVAVSVASAVRLTFRQDQLRVTLYQVSGTTATQVYQKTATFTWLTSNPTYSLSNLKAGTSYRLIAEAIDTGTNPSSKLSVDSKSTLDFTVPTATSGQLDDNVNNLVGSLTLPCAK